VRERRDGRIRSNLKERSARMQISSFSSGREET